jgi:hypothetical protein
MGTAGRPAGKAKKFIPGFFVTIPLHAKLKRIRKVEKVTATKFFSDAIERHEEKEIPKP